MSINFIALRQASVNARNTLSLFTGTLTDMDSFGTSVPTDQLFEHFEITRKTIVEAVKKKQTT